MYMVYLAYDNLEESGSTLMYYIFAGPKPVSNVIVAVDKMFVLKVATPINIVLPRFNEEDGIIK